MMPKRMGNHLIQPAEGEKQSCYEYRLSIRFRHNFKKGKIISGNDLTVAKPLDGLPPKNLSDLIGLKLKEDVKSGEPAKWNLFEQ